IDIRPDSVSYNDYIECIKGLATATWSINNEYFPNIKSEGRLRVVLLIRPDIFASLNLQNSNNKIKDNAVLLDWRTNDTDFESSKIFRLADRLLLAQQEEYHETGESWNYYFPYTLLSKNDGKRDPSFIQFLRYSLYRPRDIVTMLDFVRDVHTRNPKSNQYQFKQYDFDNGQ